ncbi:12533_t:CDS:10, partial [Funneliformis geosporum]
FWLLPPALGLLLASSFVEQAFGTSLLAFRSLRSRVEVRWKLKLQLQSGGLDNQQGGGDSGFLGPYLAGLIEGDGSIIVPSTKRHPRTNKKLYPVIKHFCPVFQTTTLVQSLYQPPFLSEAFCVYPQCTKYNGEDIVRTKFRSILQPFKGLFTDSQVGPQSLGRGGGGEQGLALKNEIHTKRSIFTLSHLEGFYNYKRCEQVSPKRVTFFVWLEQAGQHLYSVKRFLGNVRAYITLQNPSKAREFTEGLVGWKITCDAESCFTLSIHKRKRDNNWAIIPQIRIQVHKRDLPPRSSTRAGHKQSNFLIWKEPVDLIQSQAHFTSEGLARIKELKLVLNQKTPKNPLTTPLSKFSPESLQYLLGFVDGDGFFSVCRCSLSIIFKCKLDHQKHYYSTSSNSSSEGSAASSDTPTVSTYSKSDKFLEYFVGFVDGAGSFTIHRCGNYYKLQFSISQALYNIRILYYIKSKLGYGSVSTNKNKGVADFRISDRKSLAKVIFPIFDTYLLRTSKYFNYVRFKYAYDILEDPNLSSEDKAKQLESLLEEPLPVDYVSPPLGPQRGHRTSAEALDDLGPPGPALGPLRALGPQTGGTGGALKNLDPLQSPYEEISLVITDNWLSGPKIRRALWEKELAVGLSLKTLGFTVMSQIYIEGHPSTGRPGHPFSLMKQHLAMARSPGFGSDGRYYHLRSPQAGAGG